MCTVRNTEEETRIKEKAEFTKSKAGVQQDTTQWNNDMDHWAESVGGIEEAISQRDCRDGTSTTAADREKEEANLAAAATVADAANGVTADGVALPEGEDNSILRDAVKQSHY
ncbi:hypothetical protein PI124_g10593 [Phytophthora idaei]|nr:hypothetical protein PI125_g8847 [Phytophthora idaei]KAG3157580.1 hypothetical protein PI126_g8248 [Phytophthora idaei]KAG3244639.1 hypothetical protein PI124_g10593 [Phytophthora idaei]